MESSAGATAARQLHDAALEDLHALVQALHEMRASKEDAERDLGATVAMYDQVCGRGMGGKGEGELGGEWSRRWGKEEFDLPLRLVPVGFGREAAVVHGL
jgi:hypothetical protein